MKRLKNIALLTLLAGGSTAALAVGPTAELKVTGRISPPVCTVALASNGVVDYGTLMHGVTWTTDLKLQERTLANAFTITCDSPTAIGVAFTNNRVPSNGGNAAPTNAAQGVIAAGANGGWGLGLDASGNKVGGYTSSVGNATVDGTAAKWILRSAQGEIKNNWAQVAGDEGGAADSRAYAFSSDGTALAIGQVFKADYSVAASVAPRDKLDLSQAVNLDGSVTLQVNYL
ncbi:DUF1120 domain-containing protein [Cupriavidus lacunae]|uniref:DUF1120 domain-containing protein n=1 Tax=Cupriavidus lacunae TaxID=2666307 RepID=A0A370NN07_9BURK|nr:DUF1120 domain-containing protein [Cupriavidus lacunae]RDK06969.1 hypothetical protein DN412_28835 [Cupriavidus lacunae]